jgi:tetrapyrrole methylase family protein/MazG family protein
VTIHSFESETGQRSSLTQVQDAIVERLLELGRRPEGVLYAAPGHPLIEDGICAQVLKTAPAEGLAIRIVGGISFLEPTFAALAMGCPPGLVLWDAIALGQMHVPPFPPDVPALVSHMHSKGVASEVKGVLGSAYPGTHVVKLIHATSASGRKVESLPLSDIDGRGSLSALTSLYVPPLEVGTSVEALQELVARLRAPDGCPWDREQTHESLRRHLLEESYEALAAMDAGSVEGMREEFGDLLLQIMLNSQIASEQGEFRLGDVSKRIHDKIVRRHPHVFGDLKLDGVEGVLANWEKLKERERDEKAEPGGLLEGVPQALPALIQAQEYQERAARVGFDWPELEGVLDKIAEEIREVKDAKAPSALAAELGDLLFALVNLARWKGVDAESALRAANVRFKKRFGFVEQGARLRRQRLSDLTLEDMEALWQQAKAAE